MRVGLVVGLSGALCFFWAAQPLSAQAPAGESPAEQEFSREGRAPPGKPPALLKFRTGVSTALPPPEFRLRHPTVRPDATHELESLLDALFAAGPLLPGLPGGLPRMPRLAGSPRTRELAPAPTDAGAERLLLVPLGEGNAARAQTRERAAEVPIGLQRHPTINFGFLDAVPFTFGSGADAIVPAQVSFAISTEIRHADNIASVPRARAVQDTIVEYTPLLRILVGAAPDRRGDLSAAPEYHLQLEYLPTVLQLVRPELVRTAQRARGEFGLVTPITSALLRLEYDENLFRFGSRDSVEDSYTLFEVSPLLTYALSLKSLLHVQAIYDLITLPTRGTGRSEYAFEAGLDWELSPKTKFGIGSEVRRIIFEARALGILDSESAYVTLTWKPSPKLSFQIRAGVELRQLRREPPNGERIDPVILSVINWTPDATTRVNAGIRVQSRPSVTQQGELYQEIRLTVDATHDLGSRFYTRGEVVATRREYDTGRRENELLLRPALGYHTSLGRGFDAFNWEVFYQFRLGRSNIVNRDFTQNVLGLQTTLYF